MSPIFQSMLASRERGLYCPHLSVIMYTFVHPAGRRCLPYWMSVKSMLLPVSVARPEEEVRSIVVAMMGTSEI